MTAVAHGAHDIKPPTSAHTARVPRATGCPTVAVRPLVYPITATGPLGGGEPTDQALWRPWMALIGPSAFADLLRLMAAARVGRGIKAPGGLPVLVEHQLVRWNGGRPVVNERIPRPPDHALKRLPHSLRRLLTPERGAA